MAISLAIRFFLVFAASNCATGGIGAVALPGLAVHTSNDASGLTGGVPFKEWMHGLAFTVPSHVTTGPVGEEEPSLSTNGGKCTNLTIGQVVAQDLGYDSRSPGIKYIVSGVSIHCEILAREETLTVLFDLVDASIELDLVLTPVQPPGALYPVPFGALTVAHCSMAGTLDHLYFSGTSILEGPLDIVRTMVEHMINTELPTLACEQMKPAFEERITTFLQQFTAQLVPLLAGPQQASQPEPVAAVPLVDWNSYPPYQLSRALVAARPAAIASLMARVPTYDVPFQRIPVNRTVTIEADGSVVHTFLKSLRIEGLGSFVPSSLQITGLGHMLTTSASFTKVRLISSIQLQISTLGNLMAQQLGEPVATASSSLLEQFDLALDLNSLSAQVESLAMVSQEGLDSLEVDQMQSTACLVSSCRGAAAFPGTPVGLRRVVDVNVTPAVNTVAPGSLEAGLADALDTTLAVMLRGYLPALKAILLSQVQLANRTMEETVQQFIAQTPACETSKVYYGPSDLVGNALLWSGVAIAVIGLLAGLVAAAIQDNQDAALSNHLSGHPCVPRSVAVAFPFLVISTVVLFIFSDLSLGSLVNIIFTADGQQKVIGPAFSFSVLTIFRDSWNAGAYCIAFLVAGLSGVWPFAKLIFLVVAWWVPPQCLKLSTRGRLLSFLDQYGKYSLIDSWLAILALDSYNLSWAGSGTSVTVDPVPMLPFFLFVIATVASLLLGHIATHYHKRAMDFDDGALDGYVDMRAPKSLLQMRSKSVLWVLVLLLTTVVMLAGALTTSFEMTTSGAIPQLLQEPEQMTMKFSLYSLGSYISRNDPSPPVGVRTVQIIYFAFAFFIPVALMLALLCLFLVPLDYPRQRATLKFCQILDAWAAYDVFALAVLVAKFEFETLIRFLVYNDNLASICNWVKTELTIECLHLKCDLTAGSILLFVGGVASYAVPKLAFRFCQVALSEIDSETEIDSFSEDDLGTPGRGHSRVEEDYYDQEGNNLLQPPFHHGFMQFQT